MYIKRRLLVIIYRCQALIILNLISFICGCTGLLDLISSTTEEENLKLKYAHNINYILLIIFQLISLKIGYAKLKNKTWKEKKYFISITFILFIISWIFRVSIINLFFNNFSEYFKKKPFLSLIIFSEFIQAFVITIILFNNFLKRIYYYFTYRPSLNDLDERIVNIHNLSERFDITGNNNFSDLNQDVIHEIRIHPEYIKLQLNNLNISHEDFKNNNIENNIMCTICQDDFESVLKNNPKKYKSKIIKLDCNHFFHYLCFEIYLKKIEILGNISCPNCRKDIISII